MSPIDFRGLMYNVELFAEYVRNNMQTYIGHLAVTYGPCIIQNHCPCFVHNGDVKIFCSSNTKRLVISISFVRPVSGALLKCRSWKNLTFLTGGYPTFFDSRHPKVISKNPEAYTFDTRSVVSRALILSKTRPDCGVLITVSTYAHLFFLFVTFKTLNPEGAGEPKPHCLLKIIRFCSFRNNCPRATGNSS